MLRGLKLASMNGSRRVALFSTSESKPASAESIWKKDPLTTHEILKAVESLDNSTKSLLNVCTEHGKRISELEAAVEQKAKRQWKNNDIWWGAVVAAFFGANVFSTWQTERTKRVLAAPKQVVPIYE